MFRQLGALFALLGGMIFLMLGGGLQGYGSEASGPPGRA